MVLLVVLLSLVVTACADDAVDTVGEPEEVPAAELEIAVSDAASLLLEAPAVLVTEVRQFSSGREEWRWIDHRSEGEYAVVELVEFIGEDGEEASTRVTATIVRGTIEYTAQRRSGRPSTTWAALDRSEGFRMQLGHPLPRALPVLTRDIESGQISFYPGFFEAFEDESLEMTFSRQGTDDGGSLWTFSVRPRDHTAEISWTFGVHPDGHLRYYVSETTPPNEETTSTLMPEPSRMIRSEVELEPVEEGIQPIQPPRVGAPLDLSRFDLPDEFPSTS